jgi:hypothetical protein
MYMSIIDDCLSEVKKTVSAILDHAVDDIRFFENLSDEKRSVIVEVLPF